MVKRARAEATWESYGDAFRLFLRGATLATAVRIAAVVGTWLSLMNQGRAIVDGNAPWVKVALNYLTFDRSLDAPTWTALLAEGVAVLRSASRNPVGCLSPSVDDG